MNTKTFEGRKSISDHPIVSREEWVKARKELLKKEKEFTRLRDQLNAKCRELPWVRVDKRYVFDGPNGKESLADLFGGRSQLIVNHFMLGRGWGERCVGCSFGADHNDGLVVHLEHHDVAFVAISRPPRLEIEPFKTRMGCRCKWRPSFRRDFNYAYHLSFT